ncbi:sodium/glutamate symporter [Oceanobacillus bengalensis]|uniref:Sodium:glutamate symporter n=1 Tax=Oceanobacillus bengalensis TaxID=1435466 RepID=A0A494YRN4_9BACI|nr:sodium/glutamate symporter [Oceanobacillus bengalensis]RKQ12133.1 sodium:glutamate symporter [Oceanobacillus bengalensis]
MEFSPWVFFTDLGFISILLIIGTILRAKIQFIQRLFIPASILAGILGLALGPNGVNIIPFSDQIGTYPAILIALIFGSIPLTARTPKWSTIRDRVGSMWAYSQLSMIVMWGGGLLFSLLLINPFWDNLHLGFGLILAAGFVGGHGTAAAIGETFSQHGWEEATTLAMTSATVGVLAAIILGILFIKIGSTRGQTSFLSSFDQLPNELRTGLIPSNLRTKVETDTVSSISIDPYVFHMAIVFLIGLGGYYLSKLGEFLIPAVSIPAFSLAFIVGLIVSRILVVTNSEEYVSSEVVNRISGSATDLLVAFGIASISISVVMEYAIPLLLLFAFGLALAYFIFAVLSKRFFRQYWFERGVFTWGWNTGTVAMGIALLRIVDPKSESRTLDDYGLAYIPIAPVEVLLITFAPLFIVSLHPYIFIGIIVLFIIVIFGISFKNKWFQRYKG